jgi:hypothetical protein
MLALAADFRTELDRTGVNRSALARTKGVSRAWVSQVMALERLTPDACAQLAGFGDDETAARRDAMKIARLPASAQLRALNALRLRNKGGRS